MTGEQPPVNTVRLSDTGRQFVVDECVLCGETHCHGAADAVVARGGQSSRVAHCSGRHTQYLLELADDADPPAWWYDWVGLEEVPA
jgi:hypothetical protein